MRANTMDNEEHRRALALRRKAKGRPHLTLSKEETKHQYTIGFSRPGVLAPMSAIAAGDMLRRQIERREEFEALQGAGVVHVHNGKPLTAQGAKLLGVPWPPQPDDEAEPANVPKPTDIP